MKIADEATIKGLLKKFDKNNDGEITVEEFNRAIGGDEPNRPEPSFQP